MSPQAIKLIRGNFVLYPVSARIISSLCYVLHLDYTKPTISLHCLFLQVLVHNVLLSLWGPTLQASGFLGGLVDAGVSVCPIVL